ncbi:MAG: N-acetylmuramoyl-L-alanine amidase [Clostridiales bacterium]|jgi:N-acetylmuramoyl-L-alanine amidase|nr:N-acetylmuramoyl-L-alanine amidase [Clostridiales bacterium]
MAYTFHQNLCPPGLANNPNRAINRVKYITVHTTSGYKLDSDAENHANFLYTGSGGHKTSWHYTVDAENVWQSFEDTRACWHAGDGEGDGNMSSLGVKICVNDRHRFSEACGNAAELIAGLMVRHNLDMDRVVQHNFWNGKECPKELRTGEWDVTWSDFMSYVNTAQTFLLDTLGEEADNVSDWASEAWEWGLKRGVIDSSDPHGYMSKEAVIALMYKVLSN